MRYKLRDDVVLGEVAGEYVLVALRSAWDEVAFVRSMPKRHAALLRCLEQGLSDEEMLERVDLNERFTPDFMVRTYHAMKEGKLYGGYLVEVKE